MRMIIMGGCILILLAGTFAFLSGGSDADDRKEMEWTVRKGNFQIRVVQEGTILAKENVSIRMKTESSWSDRLVVSKLLEEGALVKKGDVVIEFDRSEMAQNISDMELKVQVSRNNLLQAEENLKIQVLGNRDGIKRAQNGVRSASLNLKKWDELEAPDLIRKAEVAIWESKNNLKEAEKNVVQMEELSKEDLASRHEVDKAKLNLEKARNQLDFARSRLKMLKKYDHPLRRTILEQALEEKTAVLTSLKSTNKSKLAQMKSEVLSAKASLKRQETNLKKLKMDEKQFTLRAPVDGILLYGSSDRNHWYSDSDPELKVGTRKHSGQTFMTIPDLSTLKVNLKVSESEVSRVKAGMEASVWPEAFPEVLLKGEIVKIDAIATTDDWWDQNGPGKYKVELKIKKADERLRPGMKGKVEIIVDEIRDAIHVPIESVFQKNDKTVCHVNTGKKIEARNVRVGRSSRDYVEILEGLNEGERVTLYDPGKP